MSYFLWFEEHAKKHRALVEKLIVKNYTQKEILEYFDFENMVKHEPSFCLLYASQKKCHDVKVLNCYLCACPHFRFCDEGLKQEKSLMIKSMCAISSAKSTLFVHEGIGHLDCSSCTLPHTKAFIRKHFDRDWKEVMKECLTSPKVNEKQ